MTARWVWNEQLERDEVEVTWSREYFLKNGTQTVSERGTLVLDEARVAMLGIPNPLPNLEAVQSLIDGLGLIAEQLGGRP